MENPDKQKSSKNLSRRNSFLISTKRFSIQIRNYDELEKGLARIFSGPPTLNGYKNNITSLLNTIGMPVKDLLKLVIYSLSKLSRKPNEINIITSYLFLMNDFMKLMREKDQTKKEQHILKDLLSLSSSIQYKKYLKNNIIMKYGELGNTAIILLNGQVDVLIKFSKSKIINGIMYLYYIAYMLKYQEYGLINDTINENFNLFPIEIIDDIGENTINLDDDNNYKSNNNIENIIENNIIHKQNNVLRKISNSKINSNFLYENSDKDVHNIKKNSNILNNNESSKMIFKLNIENEEMKDFRHTFKIKAKKLLKLFNFKIMDKKQLKIISTENYIKNLDIQNIFENCHCSISDTEKLFPNFEEFNEFKNIKLYSYNKISTIDTGSLFGEMALSDANSLRKGTIITTSECHCAILNRKIFNDCLRLGAQKQLRELVRFFINLPIFSGIPENVFYKKYFFNLSKKVLNRGKFVIIQGEKPEFISFIKTGSYGLTTRMSLLDLTKLINFYVRNNEKKKEKLLKIIKEAEKLMADNIRFKKFYLTENNLRVNEISCPDIIGNQEYIGPNGTYVFSIEAKSSENIIYTLNNKFYNELLRKNISVKENQNELLQNKIDLLIQRLLIIRNCMMNSFFDYKCEKEIDNLIFKEFEQKRNLKIKTKRSPKFKSVNCIFNDENKIIKPNIELFHSPLISKKNTKTKFNKIKIPKSVNSRNKKFLPKSAISTPNQRNKTKRINFTAKIRMKKNSEDFVKNQPRNAPLSPTQMQLSKTSAYFIKKNNFNFIGNFQKKRRNYFCFDYYNKNENSNSNLYKTNIFSKTLKEINKNRFENSGYFSAKSQSMKINKIKSSNLFEILNNFNDNDYNDSVGQNYSYKTFKTPKYISMNNLVWENLKYKFNFPLHLLMKKSFKILNNTNTNISDIDIKNKCQTKRIRINSNVISSSKSYENKNTNDKKLINMINSYDKINTNYIENILIKDTKKSSSHSHHINFNNLNQNKETSKKEHKIKNNFNINNNPENVPNIKLKIKKFISPEEVSFMNEMNKMRNMLEITKYLEIKKGKYNLDRNNYYKKNVVNRMKIFCRLEKK